MLCRGLALGIALTVYGREEEADTLIEQMTRDQLFYVMGECMHWHWRMLVHQITRQSANYFILLYLM